MLAMWARAISKNRENSVRTLDVPNFLSPLRAHARIYSVIDYFAVTCQRCRRYGYTLGHFGTWRPRDEKVPRDFLQALGLFEKVRDLLRRYRGSENDRLTVKNAIAV